MHRLQKLPNIVAGFFGTLLASMQKYEALLATGLISNGEEEKIGRSTSQYRDFITPNVSDPTYSILKSHLLFEELLMDFVERQVAHPKFLENAKLSFSQLLSLSRASSKLMAPDGWEWDAIAQLNSLRNLLAHNIEPKAVIDRTNRLIDLIVNKFGVPFPQGIPLSQSKTIQSESTPQESSIRYRAIDVALSGLYAGMAVNLGFDVKLLLLKSQERNTAILAGSSTAEKALGSD